jgi:hypothetical protein
MQNIAIEIGKWILTDNDSNQYGRQINESTFEFKEGDEEYKKQYEVDLHDYQINTIENIINAYGYSLHPMPSNRLQNVFTTYGNRAAWIIAECIFEN